MRPSLLKHVVAIMRTTLGLTQKELADMAECSVPTIQSVELGRLKLSEALAQRLADHTGVDLGWLLRNDRSQPMVDGQERPYTRAQFEMYQAQRRYRKERPHDLAEELVDYLFLWVTFKRQMETLSWLLAHSYRRNTSRLCVYKCDIALRELGREFMTDLEPDEIKRLAEQDKKREDREAKGRRFFLGGVSELLLSFQAEIEREFKRRTKGNELMERLLRGPDLAKECLLEFKATEEDYHRKADASALAMLNEEAAAMAGAGGAPGKNGTKASKMRASKKRDGD